MEHGALGPVVHGPPLKQRVRVGPADIAYLEAGDPTGRPVVLLHGFPSHSYLWRDVAHRLGSGVWALAPDLPGLGDTEVSPFEDLSPPMLAELVLAWMDRMGVGRAAVVAHGHGGAVARCMVAGHPQRITHLALVAPTVPGTETSAYWGPGFRLARPGVEAVARAVGMPRRLGAVRAAFRAVVHDPAALPAAVVDEHLRPLADADGWERARRFLLAAAASAEDDSLAQMCRFAGPALVVWGADDPVTSPSWGVELADRLPGSGPLQLLPFCGHLAPEERTVDLVGFLRSLLEVDG